MAISTAKTILNSSTDGVAYTKLVDILSYPDMGSSPSKLDTTSLSETEFKTNILGLQEAPDLTFECNYDEAKYTAITGMTLPSYYFQVQFGTDNGTFEFQGQVKVYANGGGVDEVRKMTVTLSTSTPIEFV